MLDLQFKRMNNNNNLPDELNPKFIFQMIKGELLAQIIKGEINPVELAKNELANRGVDENLKWVGFKS